MQICTSQIYGTCELPTVVKELTMAAVEDTNDEVPRFDGDPALLVVNDSIDFTKNSVPKDVDVGSVGSNRFEARQRTQKR